ncbi:MAG: hypothetical protein QNJ70_07705 [Xenococcaceae cyanobacterium MO_207.B15]|nr:hypothetical protein [Xenococcaceae cyanobacterium MO_207.B15]
MARFNQVLGCGIAITDSPITVVQKILKQINQRLPYLRNQRDGKKRLRIARCSEVEIRRIVLSAEPVMKVNG